MINNESVNARRRKNYKANPIKARTRALTYYYKNKERVLNRIKKYRENNKVEINIKKKAADKIKDYSKKWYQRNKNYKRAYKKKYLHTETGRIKSIINGQKRRARKNNIIHNFTEAEWKRKIDSGICFGCKILMPKANLTMDHIYPISEADKDYKKTGVKKIYTIDDVQPLCKSCNSAKKNQILSLL